MKGVLSPRSLNSSFNQYIPPPATAWLLAVGSWITSVPRCPPQVSHWHTHSFQCRASQLSGPPATVGLFPSLEPQDENKPDYSFAISPSCLLITQSVSPTRFWQKLFAAFPSVPWVTGDWCQVRKWNVNFIKHPLSSLRINPDSSRTLQIKSCLCQASGQTENHFSLIPFPSSKIFFCLVNENFKCKPCFNPSEKYIFKMNIWRRKQKRKEGRFGGKGEGGGDWENQIVFSCVTHSPVGWLRRDAHPQNKWRHSLKAWTVRTFIYILSCLRENKDLKSDTLPWNSIRNIDASFWVWICGQLLACLGF